MTNPKGTVLDAATKAANSTTKDPKAVGSDLQANATFNTAIKIAKWLWDNKAAIGSTLAAMNLEKIVEVVKSWFFPKASEEYNNMTKAGQRSVDSYADALGKAFETGDQAAAVSNLKAMANVYNQQALMTTDPAMAAKFRAKAETTIAFAENIENGSIPLDPEIRSRVKEDDSKGKEASDTFANTSEKGVVENSTNDALAKSLGKDLQNLLRTTLKLLNVPELTDKNAQLVAQKMLELGAGEKVTEQVLSAYYENVQGLSPAESQDKAKGIVADASEANKQPKTKENEGAEKIQADAQKAADQGIGK
jgi:hypothetical protein